MSNSALAGWIGKTRSTRDQITAEQINKIAATFDCPAPPSDNGAYLPPGWHWAFFAEITSISGIGRDGHQALGEFLPPVTLPRRMWASGDLQIGKPLTVGETVEKTSTILAVEEKSARSGKLVFVRVGHQFNGDKGGDMHEEHAIVYREAPAPGATAPAPVMPALKATISHTMKASTVQLFRYSAITFNSHRIHYDVDFCRDEEGYDGLIIHGPLTATLLMDLAQKQAPGKRLKRFTFRAVSPLTHAHEFSLHATKPDGENISLWACNHRGELAMMAEAQLD